MGLEDHYCGDEVFSRFAHAKDPIVDAEWQAWPQRAALIEACQGDALLAKVIYRVVGTGACDYLDQRPPVLDGASPRECLASERLLRRLKESLLRFPLA